MFDAERRSSSSTTTTSRGCTGDVMLVNGRPWPVMQVEPRKYRFRMLNASISRSLDLAAEHRRPDDRRSAPTAASCRIPSAGRPCPHRDGRALRDRHRLREVQAGHARRAPEPAAATNNIEYANTDVVMAFEVGAPTLSDTAADNDASRTGPESRHDAVMGAHRERRGRTRRLDFGQARRRDRWTDQRQDLGTTSSTATTTTAAPTPASSDVEIWELQNTSGGWFHPVHVHLVDFQVLEPQRHDRRSPSSAVPRTSSTSARARRCA